MANRNVIVRISDEAKIVNIYQSFGFKVAKKSMSPTKVRLLFERDDHMPNVRALNKLEKQYRKLTKFPISLFVLAFLGIGCLVAGFILLDKIWPLSLIVAGGVFISCFAYVLFTYLMIRPKRYTLIRELLNTAKEAAGLNIIYPVPGTIANKEEHTGALRNGFKLK